MELSQTIDHQLKDQELNMDQEAENLLKSQNDGDKISCGSFEVINENEYDFEMK